MIKITVFYILNHLSENDNQHEVGEILCPLSFFTSPPFIL